MSTITERETSDQQRAIDAVQSIEWARVTAVAECERLRAEMDGLLDAYQYLYQNAATPLQQELAEGIRWSSNGD